MLRNMHRGIIHTGKVPARLEEARRRNREFAALQASLEKAVASEQFEEAATIRDSIRLLESDTAKGSEDGAAPVTRPAPHPEPAVIKEKPPSKPRKKE